LNDGAEPNSLIQGRDGALYGTAEFGGSDGVGVVFRVDTNGLGYMLLHNFSTNNNDAAWPAGITQGSDGKLYGTSQYGGTGNAGTVYYGPTGLGTIFDLNTNGAHYAVIYSFTGTEGQNPPAPPIQGLDGALYGTLSSGGTNSSGTVFRFALTPAEFSSPVVLSNGSFKFSVNGGALNYGIDASTDMINWVRLTNVLNTVGTIKFTDSTAASSPQRFFRAVWSLY